MRHITPYRVHPISHLLLHFSEVQQLLLFYFFFVDFPLFSGLPIRASCEKSFPRSLKKFHIAFFRCSGVVQSPVGGDAVKECRLERPLKAVPPCKVQFKIRNAGLRQKRTCQHPSVCQTVTSVKHPRLSARHRNTLSKSSLYNSNWIVACIGTSNTQPPIKYLYWLDINKSRNSIGLSACYTP